jgi:DNA-binding CsgD family transcriptional regulator
MSAYPNPLPDELNLGSRFKLTPTEARIALGIARGNSLAEIAHVHGISVQTARTHLKSVFLKADSPSGSACCANGALNGLGANANSRLAVLDAQL